MIRLSSTSVRTLSLTLSKNVFRVGRCMVSSSMRKTTFETFFVLDRTFLSGLFNNQGYYNILRISLVLTNIIVQLQSCMHWNQVPSFCRLLISFCALTSKTEQFIRPFLTAKPTTNSATALIFYKHQANGFREHDKIRHAWSERTCLLENSCLSS